ncbi:MAG: ThuA domain-containing protein [Acidobacteria bacterium]|nr:ThuA domain-containing protein [Acidobacteriota bacterium]
MAHSRRTFLASMAAATDPPKPVRLLVVTGGHGFDKRFFDLFASHPEWKWEHREHAPRSTSTVYSKPIARDFDVVVLYDMPKRITENEERNFLDLFRQGKGVVVLHHALCSYQTWDTFNEITGYRMRESNAGALPTFTFLHDVHFPLQKVAVDHPVLEGVPNFDVFDETYGRVYLDGGSQPLLVTNNATSMPIVAWTRTYMLSRLVMIQPGHGPQIFANEHYRRLVANAVRWVAPR